MPSMYVKINHKTRILDYNEKFAKMFKYTMNDDLATYHYFSDCMNPKDLQDMLKMTDGEQIEKTMYFKNPRMSRGKAFTVSIACNQNGLKRRILDMVPKYEYTLVLDKLELNKHEYDDLKHK